MKNGDVGDRGLGPWTKTVVWESFASKIASERIENDRVRLTML